MTIDNRPPPDDEGYDPNAGRAHAPDSDGGPWSMGGDPWSMGHLTASAAEVEKTERANGPVRCPGCKRRILRTGTPRLSPKYAILAAHYDEGVIDGWSGVCPCGASLTIYND